MRLFLKHLYCVFILCFLMSCATTPSGSVSQDASGPSASAKGSPPSLQVSETSYDFGELSEGSDYTHEFKVKNGGPGVLQITKILPA